MLIPSIPKKNKPNTKEYPEPKELNKVERQQLEWRKLLNGMSSRWKTFCNINGNLSKEHNGMKVTRI